SGAVSGNAKNSGNFGKSEKDTLLGATNYQNASTSGKSKKEILSKIPFRSLSPYAQERVRQVLGDVSMYRRLPVQLIPCEKELYDFMSYHPDTMVNIWELMGVSKMLLTELQPGQFYLEDQAGTRGKIECLYQTSDLMLIYVFGTYEGVPFPQKVSGSGLIILQNQALKGQEGENLLAIRLDAFMQINNEGVEALAKTFQPLVGKVADHNLIQITGFLGELSKTACENGIGVANMARRLERVRPEVQQEFAEVALVMANRTEIPTTMPLPYQAYQAQPTEPRQGIQRVPGTQGAVAAQPMVTEPVANRSADARSAGAHSTITRPTVPASPMQESMPNPQVGTSVLAE
ncbi:MAG: hypothetical protein Q4C70_11620, partial [Planctomycetia bacterium]|nr:hypothetical protein [Planctomycetia bacterium]